MWRDDDSDDDEFVELEDCYIHAVTDAAICLTHDGDKVWVPKSQIDDPDQYKRWDNGVSVLVREWFARKAKLI
jgi:hypothetical protein